MLFKKLVSVIIPAYNHEKYIESCLQSVVEQTYPKLELVIVNDGSADNTHEKIVDFIARHKKRFKKVSYINREHKGIGDTLNKLIALAKGEYLYQIASDDMAKPEAIETLYRFMKRNPGYALAVGDNEIIDSNNNIVYWDEVRNNVSDISEAVYSTFGGFLKVHRPDIDFNSEQFGELSTLLKGNYIPNGKMFRKSSLVKVGGYKKDFLEDWYINIMLAKKYKLKYLDQTLFCYRWHDSNSIKNTEYISRIQENMREFLESEREKPETVR